MGAINKERVLQSQSTTGDTLDSERAREFYDRSRRDRFRDEMAETQKSKTVSRPNSKPRVSRPTSARGFSGYSNPAPNHTRGASPSPMKKQNVGFGSTVNRVQSKQDPTNPIGVYAYIHENGASNTLKKQPNINNSNPFGKTTVSVDSQNRPMKSKPASVNYTDFVPVEARQVDDVLRVTRAPTTHKHATVNNMQTITSKVDVDVSEHEEASHGWPSTLEEHPNLKDRIDTWPYNQVHGNLDMNGKAKNGKKASKPQGVELTTTDTTKSMSRGVEIIQKKRIDPPILYEAPPSPVNSVDTEAAYAPGIVVDDLEQTVTVPLQMITEISAAIHTLQKYNINVPQTLVKVPIGQNHTQNVANNRKQTYESMSAAPITPTSKVKPMLLVPTDAIRPKSITPKTPKTHKMEKNYGTVDIGLQLSLVSCSEPLPSDALLLSLPMDADDDNCDTSNNTNNTNNDFPVYNVPKAQVLTTPKSKSTSSSVVLDSPIVVDSPLKMTPISNIRHLSNNMDTIDNNTIDNNTNLYSTITRKALDEAISDIALSSLLQCSEKLDALEMYSIPHLPMEGDDKEHIVNNINDPNVEDMQNKEFSGGHRGISIQKQPPKPALAISKQATVETNIMENSTPRMHIPNLKFDTLFDHVTTHHNDDHNDDLLESRRSFHEEEEDRGTNDMPLYQESTQLYHGYVDLVLDAALPCSSIELNKSSNVVITLPMYDGSNINSVPTRVPTAPVVTTTPIINTPVKIVASNVLHDNPTEPAHDDDDSIEVCEDTNAIATYPPSSQEESADLEIAIEPTPIPHNDNNRTNKAIGIVSDAIDITMQDCLTSSNTPLQGNIPIYTLPMDDGNKPKTTQQPSIAIVENEEDSEHEEESQHGHRGISLMKPAVKPVLFPTSMNNNTTISANNNRPRPAIPSRQSIKPMELTKNSRFVKLATGSTTNSPMSTPRLTNTSSSRTSPKPSVTPKQPTTPLPRSISRSRRSQSPSIQDTLQQTTQFMQTATQDEAKASNQYIPRRDSLNSEGFTVYPAPNTVPTSNSNKNTVSVSSSPSKEIAMHLQAIRDAENVYSGISCEKSPFQNTASTNNILDEDTCTLLQTRQMQMLRDTTELALVNEQCPGEVMKTYTKDIIALETGMKSINNTITADLKQIKVKQKGGDYINTPYPILYPLEPRFQETIKYYKGKTTLVEKVEDPDFDSELDEPEVETQPQKEGCVNPYQLPSPDTDAGLELLPCVFNRINDQAQEDRQKVILGQLTSDMYIDREDWKELVQQHQQHYDCTPEAATDYIAVPDADTQYAIYRARDTFEERSANLKDMQEVQRKKEEQIQNKKKHADQYKGALPYWYEMRGKHFHEEMTRNRVFGDSIARLLEHM